MNTYIHVYSRTLKTPNFETQPLIFVKMKETKLWGLLYYKVWPVLRMAWEIYCHKMNLKVWNHSDFGIGVINFVGHEQSSNLSFAFILFSDTLILYHWLLWQLNNPLRTIRQVGFNAWCMHGCFPVHTHHLNNSYLSIKCVNAVFETMGMNRKTAVHWPNIKADLSVVWRRWFSCQRSQWYKFVVTQTIWKQNKSCW